ncbi:FG-GAP-like repeat-containing protein [Rudaea sp.]|uniref:FG-GAP-like repeat-containing protein n=1 Tax=Rudaea sp. TaxID=2136325 RepID=UPI002ED43E56
MKGWIKCLALLVGLTLHVAALAQSTFVSMVPVRLMDTRGGATIDGQFSGGGPTASTTLTVLGRAGIPAGGVSAVALNVTVMDPGNFGYLLVWPTGTTQPVASNLNYVAGLSISNEVIVKVGTNGQVSIVSSGGSNIVVDVTGYFPTTSDLFPLTPARLLDTRPGMTTVDGQYAGGGAIAPGATFDLPVVGRGGVPSGVSAVVVNITATQPTGVTYITVWPSGTPQPNASNLNVISAGQTIANLVMVAPGSNGKISIYNNYGNTHLIVDVVGYFSSTITFGSLVPARLLDTRPGMPTVDGQFSGQGALGSGSTLSFTVLNRGGVPSSGVGAVALNIIAVNPSAAGYLVAWGTGTTAGNAPPLAMGVNFAASSTTPSLVIAQVGSNGQVSINNNSAGTTHVVADVVGWFPSASSGPPLQPTSVSASASGTTLTASWTLTSGGPTPTYLKIQRATSLSGPWTLVNGNYTPATSGQMSEVISATGTYYYEVAACNAAGCSAYTWSTTGAAVTVTPATPTSDSPVTAATPLTDSISDSVGATAARFRVDEGGNATYSIPIQVPPGTAGVTPKLALSYNSRLPNGVMGPGWTIEGSSQISRCRQTRESGDFGQADGNPPPVNFTATDRFCLDGVRLLRLSGNTGAYGADGTTYSPETDPTTKVTAHVSGNNVGPDSFTVQRKDGTTSTYGNTTASANALSTASLNSQTVAVNWSLARVQDSKGNYIDYLYNSRPGSSSLPFLAVETTLAQVNYTGNTQNACGTNHNQACPPYASVSFGYSPLSTTLMRLGYQSGVAFVQTQQLTSVTVTDASNTSNSTLRYYALSYLPSNSGSQFPQLQWIKECRDSTAAVCFPPTTFTWSTAQNTLQPGTKYQTPAGPNYTNLAGYKIADVDGDGRQDFVWAANNGPCGSSVSSIYVGFLDRTSTGEMTLTTASQTPTCAPINLSGNDQSWYLLDYDGDGRADLLIGGAIGSNWKVFSSLGRPSTNGAVFGTTDLLASLSPAIAVTSYTDPRGNVSTAAVGLLADLNGDGLPDFIYPTGGSGFGTRFLVRQGSALAFSPAYQVNYSVNDTNCTFANFPNASTLDCFISIFNTTSTLHRSAIAADVNGDGRSDLTALVQAVTTFEGCPTCSTSTNRRNYWSQFVVSQITPPNGSTPGVVALQETWWDTSALSASPTMPQDSNQVFVVDLNGDGLSDIVYQDATTATTYWALINNGNGYGAAIFVTGISNGQFLQLVDINGDGKTDLVYPVTSPTDSTAYSSFNYVSVAVNASGWYFTAPIQVPGGGLIGHNDWIHLIGDFDGDGAPDYFGLSTTATSNNLYASRTGTRYQPRDVITQFKNGLGATTQVSYQPLTNIGVYQRGGTNGYPALTGSIDFGWGSPVFDVLAPMYVVSQASSSAPTQANASAVSTVYYRYAGALMQGGGRGFLGFYDIWNFDANDSSAVGNQYIAVLNRYAQRFPITGMPIATVKQALGGAMTRGSAQLDACAANPETLGYNCFSGITGTSSAPTFQTLWPNIAGTQFSFSYQTPICAGPGCLMTVAASKCTVGGNTTSPAMARPTDYTAGIFSGSATPGPVFGYVSYSQDYQGDLATGTPTTPAWYAEVENWFCYDGNGAIAGTGNLAASRTLTTNAAGTTTADKVVTNTYSDNAAGWQLGRLTKSIVQFARPNQTTRQRSTNYTYDPASGFLTSERIQAGGSADQDLRTLYDLDAFGNRTGAYQCSNDVTDTQCRAGATNGSVTQRQTGTTVLRYAKTNYDNSGSYVIGSRLPFATVSGGWNEQTATAISFRDEFGNATQQNSINGTTQTALFGTLGRPYFTSDNIGHAGTTTFRMCGTGTNKVNCGSNSDNRLVFRSQVVTAGGASSWTYFDVLGRPVMKVAQAFDSNPAAQQFTASCVFTDAHNRATYQSEPFFLNATVAADGSPTISGAACSASYATTTTYDVLGRAITITTPDGTTTQQYVGLSTFVTNARHFTWETITNEMGEAVQTLDPGTVNNDTATALTVTQTYDAMGDLLTITRNAGSGNVMSSFTYDDLGRKLTQNDADSGQTTFTYNAAGDVLTQTDAKGQTITLSYDAMGRKWQRVASSTSGTWIGTITDTWNYDTQSNGFGQLTSETHVGTGDQNLTRTMIYDGYGRLYQRQHVLSGSGTYTETTAVDGYSRPKQQQDATGQVTTTHYTAKGFADRQNDSHLVTAAQSGAIDAGVGGRLYELLQTNERGQPISEKRGGSTYLATNLSYYANDGRLKGVCTNGTGTCGLQDDQYAYDAVGNVIARLKNASSGKSPVEQITYDGLNRLTKSQLGAWSGVIDNGNVINVIGTQTMTYDALGNLCTQIMTGTGVTNTSQTYTYAGPAGCANHGASGSSARVTAISGTVNQTYQYDANGNQTLRGDGRTLTYNALNQAVKAVLSSYTTTFQYGPEGDRYLRADNGVLTLYIGKVEITISGGTTTEQKRYLGAAIDLVLANDTRYVLTDHLGSTNVIARVDGTKVEQEAFDAWGNRRDPGTWTQVGTPGPIQTTTHGFTGQEGVEAMGIVHFNGRIYDPQLGRMLQADPVQNPGSQGLNRYSYVANNPLTLTDPSGYSWFSDILKTVVGAAIIYFAPYLAPYLTAFGAYAGYAAYAIAGFAAGVIQTGTLQGGLIGAFSAAVGYGIAQKFGTGLSWPGVLARSTEGGVVSSLEGGKFGNGFFSAGVSAAFAPEVSQLHNSGLQYVATALVGGTASAISGGKFANGAESAVFQKAVSDGLDQYMKGYGQMDARQQKLAYMATAAYGDKPWQLAGLLSYSIEGEQGFGATVFPYGDDGATVVAFRGTRPLVLADDVNDFRQAFNLDSKQYDQTQRLAAKIYSQTGGDVTFTGHSLGGGEAAAAAYYTGADAVTFNAAGLSSRYQISMWAGPVNGHGGVTNFYIVGDPLTTTQHFFPIPGAVGTQIALPAQQFERHSIRNFWY